MTGGDILKILAAEMKKETKKNNKTGNMNDDLYTIKALRLAKTCLCIANKPCCLQSPHDLLLHAIFSGGMDGDLCFAVQMDL